MIKDVMTTIDECIAMGVTVTQEELGLVVATSLNVKLAMTEAKYDNEILAHHAEGLAKCLGLDVEDLGYLLDVGSNVVTGHLDAVVDTTVKIGCETATSK